jgi:hypothetical protein
MPNDADQSGSETEAALLLKEETTFGVVEQAPARLKAEYWS